LANVNLNGHLCRDFVKNLHVKTGFSAKPVLNKSVMMPGVFRNFPNRQLVRILILQQFTSRPQHVATGFFT
jgi:predicted phage tail protein